MSEDTGSAIEKMAKAPYRPFRNFSASKFVDRQILLCRSTDNEAQKLWKGRSGSHLIQDLLGNVAFSIGPLQKGN